MPLMTKDGIAVVLAHVQSLRCGKCGQYDLPDQQKPNVQVIILNSHLQWGG